MNTLPTDSQERKDIPLQRGCYDYFPAALAEVARLSREGNEKHNPGEEMHHARGKSGDHADCIARHQMDRGTIDTDGFLHEVKVAWRALAQLQEALEARGAPLARAARLPSNSPKGGWLCGCGSTVPHSANTLAEINDPEHDDVVCDVESCDKYMKWVVR